MRDRIWLEFALQKIRTHSPGTRVWFASLLKHKERARSHLCTRSEAGRVERLALVTSRLIGRTARRGAGPKKRTETFSGVMLNFQSRRKKQKKQNSHSTDAYFFGSVSYEGLRMLFMCDSHLDGAKTLSMSDSMNSCCLCLYSDQHGEKDAADFLLNLQDSRS